MDDHTQDQGQRTVPPSDMDAIEFVSLFLQKPGISSKTLPCCEHCGSTRLNIIRQDPHVMNSVDDDNESVTSGR